MRWEVVAGVVGCWGFGVGSNAACNNRNMEAVLTQGTRGQSSRVGYAAEEVQQRKSLQGRDTWLEGGVS